MLYELGLHAALEWLAESIRRQTGLQVRVERESSVHELEINRRVFLYKAVRELLFNVVKHAGAEKANIKLSGNSFSISVHVIDNGQGTTPLQMTIEESQSNSGFGLFSIREQIQYYGGRLEVTPIADGGTQATITMPIEVHS